MTKGCDCLKKIITSIAVTGILIAVLFKTNDLITRIIVIPFLIFAIAMGITNVLTLMGKKILAVKISKVYVVAFLIYWFGFLIYWDYASFADGNYKNILFSVPFWLGGIYFAYKRLFKKN